MSFLSKIIYYGKNRYCFIRSYNNNYFHCHICLSAKAGLCAVACLSANSPPWSPSLFEREGECLSAVAGLSAEAGKGVSCHFLQAE